MELGWGRGGERAGGNRQSREPTNAESAADIRKMSGGGDARAELADRGHAALERLRQLPLERARVPPAAAEDGRVERGGRRQLREVVQRRLVLVLARRQGLVQQVERGRLRQVHVVRRHRWA